MFLSVALFRARPFVAIKTAVRGLFFWVALPILRGPACGTWWSVFTRSRFFVGTYERSQTRRWLEALSPGDVAIDLGAHVGHYAVLAARRVGLEGRVFAFEPEPRNARVLRWHRRLNRIRNLEIVEAAIGDVDLPAAHFERIGTGSGHVIDENHPAAGRALAVEQLSLDSLLAAGRISPPACIKIDVEGAEVRAIAGAQDLLRKHRPIVFLSTHGPDLRAASLALLEQLGYRFETFAPGDDVDQANDLVAFPSTDFAPAADAKRAEQGATAGQPDRQA